MPLGYYISGSAGQLAQRKLNDISHNLANVNTIGFMASRSSFSTQLSSHLAGASAQNAAAFPSYGNQFIDMQEGIIKKTGNDLDFAIQGPGFFRVALANGSEAYTRAGNFKQDANGALLTQGGHAVLDNNGNPVQLPPGHITATQHGDLSVDGTKVAGLGIVQIVDPSKATKASESLLKTPASNTQPATPDISVHQGSLEGSNVNSVLAMTELIDTMRGYQSTMKIVEEFNQQASLLNDRVGRIQG